jgi:HSP20 family protein
MALVRFDPFRGFEGISDKMSQFLDEFEKGFTVESGGFNPRTDISEDSKGIYVNAELPGVKKENVKIKVNEEKMLTISGEKIRKEKKEGEAGVRNECCYGEFSRSFLMPETADTDKIEANMQNGMLELKIPKKEPEKPKEKEIKIK